MSKKRKSSYEAPTPPPEIAVLAETAEFTGTDSLAAAGRAVMANHAMKLYGHLPGALSGDDPHDVHQMRVATRRLRASLEATAIAYQPDQVSKLRRHLRKLARILGEVRDRDVLLLRLRQDAAATAGDTQLHTVLERIETEEQQNELQAAIERLQTERDEAHRELVAELKRKRTARLLQELNDFLLCPLDQVQAEDDGLPLLVRHHAGSALWHEYEAVRRFETVMDTASAERLHELRIAAKHLRYTLELYEPALGETTRSLLKQVTKLQEHLGNLHDADVALAYLGAASATHVTPTAQNMQNGSTPDDTSDAQQQPMSQLSEYIQTRTAERNNLQESAKPLWQQLVGDETRQHLAQMITAL